tara:strand:- start:779 stop:1714 length:936 start_codon:yes stop_codon:yes gene_type:complete
MNYQPEEKNELYLPNKSYPTKGLISAGIEPGDEKYITKFLEGKDSRFGKYRVIEYLGRPSDRPWSKSNGKRTKKIPITWRIRCECGLERDISHSGLTVLIKDVRTGKLKPHCRCPYHQSKFAIGIEYDLLTIIGYAKLTKEEAHRTPDKKYWKQWYLACTCKCGKHAVNNPYFVPPNEIEYPLSHGLNGFGCGCKSIKHGMRETAAYMRWQNAKHRAKIRKLPFNIEVKDCIETKNCPVFGIPLISSSGKGQTPNSPHLDRLIGSKGYIKENVTTISMKANSIKNNATVAQIRLVADWFEKKLLEVKEQDL